MWVSKVHHSFKAFMATYRRPLQGVSTTADTNEMISPKRSRSPRRKELENSLRTINVFTKCSLTLKG